MSPGEWRRVRESILSSSVGKTKQLCRFYQQGKCSKGVFCIWAHGEKELQLCGASTQGLWKVKLCSHYANGWCAQGQLCTFAHGENDLRRARERVSPARRRQTTGAWLGSGAATGPLAATGGRAKIHPNAKKRANPPRQQGPPPALKALPPPPPRPSRSPASRRAASVSPTSTGGKRRRGRRQHSPSPGPPSSSPTRLPRRGAAAVRGARDGAGSTQPKTRDSKPDARATAAPTTTDEVRPNSAGRGAVVALRVSGCSDTTIASGVHGEYEAYGFNHGRPSFKSVDVGQGFQAFLYFWDDRDGPDYSGWWIGPTLGGQDVWVRHPGSPPDTWPPRSGWHAPHDGPADAGMVVEGAQRHYSPDAKAPVPVASLKETAPLTKDMKEALKHFSPDGKASSPAGPASTTKKYGEPLGGKELVSLELGLEEVRKEGELQLQRMAELQQMMQERRNKEEQILKRMRELAAPVDVVASA